MRSPERLQDPEVRQRIRSDSTYQVWSDEHGSWEGIVLANSSNPEHTRYENMTMAEIARERGDADPGMSVQCWTRLMRNAESTDASARDAPSGHR